MELENQGGMGTELNHWEKRLLEVCADTRNGRGCGSYALIFRFIVIPTVALKMQEYKISLKNITSSN